MAVDLVTKIRMIMQLREAGITDTNVLSAIERVPREMFVPPMFADQAYADMPLPIGRGQTISQPLVVAYMLQQLRLDKSQTVLEIGTGSGYQTAILAHLTRRVVSIDIFSELVETAKKRLDVLKLRNITTLVGDGHRGWPELAPFARIIVSAAAGPESPPELLDQLAPGGIMMIPLGETAFQQELVRITRTEDGFEKEISWPVRFVPLLDGVS